MKKTVAISILVCLLLLGQSLITSAQEYLFDFSLEDNQAAAIIELNKTYAKYAVPKAKKAPVIDGVFSEGEWDGALQIVVDSETLKLCNTNMEIGEGTVINLMWSDQTGLMFGAYVNDLHKSEKRLDGDFIQICLFSSRTSSACDGEQNLFLDFHPFSDEGRTSESAFIYENYLVKDRIAGEIASSNGNSDGDYYMEWALSWEMLDGLCKSGFEKEYDADAGEEFVMQFVVYDTSKKGGSNELFYTGSTWMNAFATDVFVLVNESSVLNNAVASDKRDGGAQSIEFMTVPEEEETDPVTPVTRKNNNESKDTDNTPATEPGKTPATEGKNTAVYFIVGGVAVVAIIIAVIVIVKKKKQ